MTCLFKVLIASLIAHHHHDDRDFGDINKCDLSIFSILSETVLRMDGLGVKCLEVDSLISLIV